MTTDTMDTKIVTSASKSGSARRTQILTFLRYLVLSIVALITVVPFVLAFFGSFKTSAEITAFPPTILPEVWQWQNWPDLFNTDLGGFPRPEGTTSIGVVVGLFAFYVTFFLTALSPQPKEKGLARKAALLISVLVIAFASYLITLFLVLAADASLMLQITTAVAMAVLMYIALGLLAMSQPDWKRLLISLIASLVVLAVVMVVFNQIAIWFGGGTFFRWLFNTALLSIVRASLQVLFCSMAAYAFARLDFPWKGPIFAFMLGSMMLPGAVTMIPAFVLMAELKWINTFYSLVFPGIIVAFGIFLLTQFFKAIPHDLEESAYIDGASYFQIYKDIILPLARPALLTLFILQFQSMWNDFLTPLLYLNTADMWVLNVGLQVFQQQYASQMNLVLVGAMVNAVPVIVLFFIFSKYYIEGVSYAGVKG